MKLAHHLRHFWHCAAARGAKRIPGAAFAVRYIKKFMAWFEYGGREFVTIHDGIRIYLRNDPNCEIRLAYLPYMLGVVEIMATR